jgi:hypothetical protein
MPVPALAALLSSQLVVTVADRVPVFDVGPSCRESSISDCLRQEEIAREKLAEQWPQFTAAEKARCAADARYAGHPSYVGWLTCLQINADTRNVPATVGAAPKGASPGGSAGGETGSQARDAAPRRRR